MTAPELIDALIRRGKGRRSAKHAMFLAQRATTLPALRRAIDPRRPKDEPR